MPRVALIASAQCDRAALRRVGAGGAWVYTVTREGILRAVNGPEADKIHTLPVQGIVWLGVPSRWVSTLGLADVEHQHHAGSKRTWGKGSVEVAQKALGSMVSKLERKETHAAREVERERIASARKAALFVPPPWFIPERLT